MGIKKLMDSTDIMVIVLKYDGEKIKIDLRQELKVNENRINKEIKDQPSYYGFLCMLRNKLKRVMDDKEFQMKKAYSKKFCYYKEQTNPHTQRVNNDDLAKQLTIKSTSYGKAVNAFNEAEYNYNTVKDAVESFDQRSSLIQTLSANLRGELKSA